MRSELDVLEIEVVEESAPFAEEHRDEIDLELIEDAGPVCELCGSAPWTSTFLSPAASLAWVIAVLTSAT